MRLELKQAMGAVIKSARLKRNVAQESMGASQSYISALENGKWSASLDKIEQMANALGMHPASIILAGYLTADNVVDVEESIARIRAEVDEILS